MTGITAFTANEENELVSFLFSYAATGYPLSTHDLLDAAEVSISSFDASRRGRLPFKSSRPRAKFARCFRRRNAGKLRFERSTKEETIVYKQFAATNAHNLTYFFSAIEEVISDNNIDEQCICNLDECRISAETDKFGNLEKWFIH